MPVLQPPKAAPPVDGLSDRVFLQTADFGPPPPPKDQAYYFRSLQRALPKNYVDGLTVAGGCRESVRRGGCHSSRLLGGVPVERRNACRLRAARAAGHRLGVLLATILYGGSGDRQARHHRRNE